MQGDRLPDDITSRRAVLPRLSQYPHDRVHQAARFRPQRDQGALAHGALEGDDAPRRGGLVLDRLNHCGDRWRYLICRRRRSCDVPARSRPTALARIPLGPTIVL
jgi:hypothetical protein